MNAQNLSDEVIATVMLAQERVGPGSIGEQQYYDALTNTQGFERMDFDSLLQYAEEEALDFINYGVMIRIRIARLRNQIAAARAAAEVESVVQRMDGTSD